MNLRFFLDKARESRLLTVVTDEVDPHLEMAQVISRLEGPPLLFERAKGYDCSVAAHYQAAAPRLTAIPNRARPRLRMCCLPRS